VSFYNKLILTVKRGDNVFARSVRALARAFYRPPTFHIPGLLRPLLRVVYELHYAVVVFFRNTITVLYRNPIFQGRCASVGRNLWIDNLPFVNGHAEIHIGNDVYLGGNITISSGRFIDAPKLIIHDRAQINWNTSIVVNREVIIEEDARISFNCRISDSDGHPRQADLRLQNAPISPRDIRPVRIGRNAWIGNASHIMKGVTIGEGAIIGANSVVINDVPPYALALGNPAEVYFPNFGRPSRRATPNSGS
jgi:acetyltransferase-like isoleucine patch superfamily enzyme